MFKKAVVLNLILVVLPAAGDAVLSNHNNGCTEIDTVKTIFKPEFLSSGFIDIINTGQVNASARLIRIYIGEPGKLAIPLSVYSGVSSNNFQNQQNPLSYKSNEQLVSNFINPLSGLANISIDGIRLLKKKSNRLTKAGLMYYIGERILTGFKTGLPADPATGRPVNFLNSVGYAGLYFQTGAWDKSSAGNIGVCWLTLRYIVSHSRPGQLKEILNNPGIKGYYHGWSAGWGVDINNLVNIKVLFYKYITVPEPAFLAPVYQFSFNYSMK